MSNIKRTISWFDIRELYRRGMRCCDIAKAARVGRDTVDACKNIPSHKRVPLVATNDIIAMRDTSSKAAFLFIRPDGLESAWGFGTRELMKGTDPEVL